MANPNPKLENLKPFPKGVSGNPRGARPSMIKKVEKLAETEYNVNLSRGDISRIAQSLIEKKVEELEGIRDSETEPVFVKAMASAILSDLKHSRINTINLLLDRILGKPTFEIKTPDPGREITLIEVRYAVDE